MKKPTLLFICLISLCCRKQNGTSLPDDRLGTVYDRVVEIGEKLTIYDSTTLDDSLHFFNPPANRLYEWSVSPNDGSVSLGGSYETGRADVLFSHAGSYSISAVFRDPISHLLLGKTDTTTIVVTTDTLRRIQAFYRNDSLVVTTGIYGSASQRSLSLTLSTVKEYDFNPLYSNFLEATIAYNNISFVFSDSILLTTYPFAYKYGGKARAVESFLFPYVPGDIFPLAITWLDKTYYGTIEADTLGRVHVSWQNGVVSFQ